jgi:hypothetical protein
MADISYLQSLATALDGEPGLRAFSGQKVFPVYTKGAEPTAVMVLVEKQWPIGTPVEEILKDLHG